jgi:hypothetical protein
MMKQLIFTGVLLLASAMTGEAMADCSTKQVLDLRKVLSGNTICAPYPAPVAVPPLPVIWDSQEMHMGTTNVSISGELWDYKRGGDTNIYPPATLPANVIDPTIKVGTYELLNQTNSPCGIITNDCKRVRYNYTAFNPNQTYIFRVYRVSGTLGAAGSVYDFCTVGAVTPSATGRLKIGTGAGCP